MMGGKTIVAKEPRASFLLANEINGHVGAPGGLAVFSGDPLFCVGRGFPFIEAIPALSLLS